MVMLNPTSTRPGNPHGPMNMKTLILSLAIVSSIATFARAAQNSSAQGVAPGAFPGTPGSFYTYNPAATFPWQTGEKGEKVAAGRLTRLLTELQEDLDTVLPALNSVTGSVDYASIPQVTSLDSAAAERATGFDTLPARDLSTLYSQDFSVNLGQNLATSFAVPTCPPWSTMGHGAVMVLANVGGDVVGLPAFPPRTAWGNGVGSVVTTPGGAVYAVVPGYSMSITNDAGAAREALHQLSIVQDDLARIRRYLATTEPANPALPSPTVPPAYLPPTGR